MPTTMQEYFQKFKSNLELNPALESTIATRHQAIRGYLKNNHPGFKSSNLIGSLQRKTRIHPGTQHDIDVDVLVVLGEFHRWVPGGSGGVTAQSALSSLQNTVTSSARYNQMEPIIDPPTIKLTAGDGLQVELVPAYVDMIGKDSSGRVVGPVGRGYWVVKDGKWQLADYDHEADWISSRNALSDGYLIPTIKMLKAAKRIYFPELGSFQLEVLAAHVVVDAVTARKMLGWNLSYEALVWEFFEGAREKLAAPIQVPGSKSVPIQLDPVTVGTLAKKFGEIANYIKAIPNQPLQSERIALWRKLFGDHFPTTI